MIEYFLWFTGPILVFCLIAPIVEYYKKILYKTYLWFILLFGFIFLFINQSVQNGLLKDCTALGVAFCFIFFIMGLFFLLWGCLFLMAILKKKNGVIE